MNRATVGSVLFVTAALIFMGAPSEGDALAGPGLEIAPSQPALKAETKLAANAGLKPVATPDIGTTGNCADGMLEVEGDYCAEVEQPCKRYIDPEGVFPRRCAEFGPTTKCASKTSKKHFCMDRYEWPNKAGENPVVMKTWYEAKASCEGIGKRLCADSEWTVACEGQERLPYPYGYDRNSEACNIDKPHPDVNEKALGSNDPKVREAEAKRLWQGEPSGSRASCVSPYGVFDMTGNVDEWVVNEGGTISANPFKSGLKGGYWGPVRDRCRPMTTVHGPDFSFYQIGFRCCSDVPATKPSNPAAPPSNKGVPSTNPGPGAVIGS